MQRQGSGPPSNKRSTPQQRPQQGQGGQPQGQRSHGNRPRHSGRGKGQDNRNRQQSNQGGAGQNKAKAQTPTSNTAKKLEPGVTPDGRSFGNVVESHKPKKYGCIFFDTFQQARSDVSKLAELARTVDQLNIVIKAEGDMNDPELRTYGMVYAGAAWHLIHTRRIEENWYEAPR